MDFSIIPYEEQKKLSKYMFEPLSSAEHIKDWVKLFLNLELPVDVMDSDSNSSPLDAIWQIYDTFKRNAGDVTPGFILMSSRESLKTISVAILEVLLIVHFQAEIGHASATEDQSAVALGYIETFFMSIQVLLDIAGWENKTKNKRLTKFKTPQGKTPYIKVIILSMKGMNSLHSQILVLDELDLGDPRAIKEGKNITGFSKGVYGIKIYLSTRKYAFGNMAKAIDDAPSMNYKLLNWNILDVTEKCPPSRHIPDGIKEDVYVAKNLPLKQISIEEFNLLPDAEKPKFDLIKDSYEGCRKCLLLPVCKKRLAAKPNSATGGFYKPIVSVIQKFRENDPDIAEAQLLCFGPTTQILMSDGTSKDIQNVAIGDEVITHTGAINKVTKVMSREYAGEVFTVENVNWKHFLPTIVTSEHPYFVNGMDFKSISEISTFKFDKWGSPTSNGDYLSLPIAYTPSDATEIKFVDLVDKEIKECEDSADFVRVKSSIGRYVPSKYPLNYDFGWITGYFLAEGCHTVAIYTKAKHFCSVSFASDIRETEYHQKVRDFANFCKLTTSEFKSKIGYGNSIDLYNPSIAELFFAMCGRYSDKKRIHSTLMNANLEFLKGILEGFDAGDGTKRKKPHKELTTTSYLLASQLFTIAARLGLCPRLTKKPTPKKGKQPYLVHYIDKDHVHKQKRTKFKVDNGYNQYRLDNLKTEKYCGYVYNLEVEKDHSYIANGIAVHNCWKPGSEGLVYPRFSTVPEKGNVMTLKEAYTSFVGPTTKAFVSEMDLLYELQKAEIPIYASVDWGFTHDSVIVIAAKMPNDEIWVIDCFAAPGLEFSDVLQIAMSYRDKYNVQKWYCDQAMPSSIKSFNKNGMKAPRFTKDVLGGIDSIRSKIVNASGKRLLKIIATANTKKVISAIQKHRFKMDGQGNLTTEPDDERGIADICDALRYMGQNLFPVRGDRKPEVSWTDIKSGPDDNPNPTTTQQMKEEIAKRVSDDGIARGGTGKKGGFFWNI